MGSIAWWVITVVMLNVVLYLAARESIRERKKRRRMDHSRVTHVTEIGDPIELTPADIEMLRNIQAACGPASKRS